MDLAAKIVVLGLFSVLDWRLSRVGSPTKYSIECSKSLAPVTMKTCSSLSWGERIPGPKTNTTPNTGPAQERFKFSLTDSLDF